MAIDITHTSDAISYMMEAQGIYKPMSCYRIEEKMRELKRCGCRQCYDEYRRLDREYYYEYRNYYASISSPPINRIKSLVEVQAKINEEKKMNTADVVEPKNVAVKTLVDKLKAEQAGLTSTKATIDSYKKTRKQYDEMIKNQNKTKNEKEKAIRELSVALKKLGHKET